MATDWHQHAEPTEDGHLLWTGRLHRGGPAVYYRSKRRSVRNLIFEQDRGRLPVGRVEATCGPGLCIHPAHLLDYAERQVRHAERARDLGLPTYEGECRNRHRWADTAHFDRSGVRRCSACAIDLPAGADLIAVELAAAGQRVELSWPERREAARLLIRRGVTHRQCADLVGACVRTVDRWASINGWHKPAAH